MKELEVLKRRLEREIKARKEAERILEEKALELFHSNEQLRKLNQNLEDTVQKRTRELAQSQKQFQSLVESAGDIIYNANVKGHFTYVNPMSEKVLGYSKEELIGRHYTEFVQKKYVDKVRQFYLQTLKNNKKTSYYEFPVINKKGRIIWLGQKVQIEYQADGNHKITAVARDISELVQARKALESSEEKYRGIINNMELGLLEVDLNGKITKAYDWFCDMTGYTAEELVGKDPIEVFMRPEQIPIMKEQDANRKRGQTGVYEIEMRKKNGEYIWVAISGAPFYNIKGKMIGSIGIHLDISYQKKMQAQLEAARYEAEKARKAEQDFLAYMSHEIRTPLNAVVGMANLLASTRLDDAQQVYVQDIKYAADVLHGLVSDVLDITKIEAGEVEVVESELNLEQSIAMLCKTLDYRAKEKGNKLTYSIKENVPAFILADRNFLNQILLNLLGNALKFTENGAIKVAVEKIGEVEDGVFLKFEVSDTGIGISADKADKVFERFKQEKAETQRQYGGTGLGLAISRQLVELHGGRIYVESKEGEGSTFIFSFRVKEVETSTSNTFVPTGAETHSLESAFILVAEDNEFNLRYIQALLDQWKVKYRIASNGKEAVRLSEIEEFDLILMDMQMPVLNGYEACQAIRKDPGNPNQNVAILALTASALLDEKRKAREAEMNDHLTKPFTPDQLYAFISQNLRIEVSENVNEEVHQNAFSALGLPKGFDAKALEDTYQGDIEYALQMITLYMKSIEEEWKKGEANLKAKDYKELVTWVHKLASNFTMVGLPHISEQFRKTEKELKEKKSLTGYQTKIEKLILEVKKSKPKVKELGETLLKAIEND